MSLDRLFNILGSIVVLATVTVVVTNGARTANVIRSFGGAFSSTVKTAMGR